MEELEARLLNSRVGVFSVWAMLVDLEQHLNGNKLLCTVCILYDSHHEAFLDELKYNGMAL